MQSMYTQYQQSLKAASATNHRQLIVISGPRQWALDALDTVIQQAQPNNLVVVQDEQSAEQLSAYGPVCLSHQAKHYLGTELETLVWDGFSGFNPEAFGITSGLLVGGGVLFLLLPPLADWQQQPDADYLRMCASPDELQRCSSYFLQRCAALILTDQHCLLFTPETFQADQVSSVQEPSNPKPKPALKNTLEQLPLSTDQQQALTAIERVAKGHRHRPLVITADRGRGKTSILGIAAAQQLHDFMLQAKSMPEQAAKRIIITAPNKQAVSTAFKHFQNYLAAHYPKHDSHYFDEINPGLEFVAPDELLNTDYEADLLMVDEASAIPAPVLQRLLQRYPRIVFSSTIHGYEGNGQGFAVRFRQTLDQYCPQWKPLALKQAIRWAENDPLEALTFRMLCLDATLTPVSKAHGHSPASAVLSNIDRQSLLNCSHRLSQIMALLVSAHYQTSPSDLRLLLDHPDVSISLAIDRDCVVGVVLCMHEGNLSDDALADDIIAGRRRPRGHLMPQALATFFGKKELMSLSCLRIMRIAVHPALQQQGLGCQLVQHVVMQARAQLKAYVAVSFGQTSNLAAFWQKNGFHCLRMGYHLDAASGTRSVFYAQALSPQTTSLFEQLASHFIEHLIFGCTHYFRNSPWQHIDILLKHTGTRCSQVLVPLSSQEQQSLSLFAFQQRSEYDTAFALHRAITLAYQQGHMHTLDTEHRAILVLRGLQQRSWAEIAKELDISGRKAGEKKLKQACECLLQKFSA